MRKKVLSILFALVLVLGLSLVTAVPVGAQGAPIGDPFFTTSNLGEAGWSKDQATFGEYSAKLWIPAYDSERQYDEARVVFNYDGDLNSIIGVSYPSYVIGGNDGDLYPMVVLAVDSTGDENVDSWVCQWGPYDHTPLENAWETISFDGNSPVHVAGARTGLPDGHYMPYTTEFTESDTLTLLKNEWGELTVLEVKVFMGAFTNLTEAMTAYVDDVIINGIVYELEPSGDVDVIVDIPEITAISVNPTSIDFGTLYPGDSSVVTTLTVENIGTVTVNVDARVDPTPTVFDNLLVGSLPVPTTDLIVGLVGGTTADPVTIQLVVPSDYSAKGVESATLIFEVTAVP